MDTNNFYNLGSYRALEKLGVVSGGLRAGWEAMAPALRQKLVGGGIGAGVGALAGGEDNRLLGAALGGLGGAVGGRMIGKRMHRAARRQAGEFSRAMRGQEEAFLGAEGVPGFGGGVDVTRMGVDPALVKQELQRIQGATFPIFRRPPVGG